MHLTLYGEVSWQRGRESVPVPAGIPTLVVLALASARGGAVRAEALADRLWAAPPASGLNALQRHVSRLRTHLRSIGVDPDVVIESTGSAYRLGAAVTTDLDAVDEILNGGADIPEPFGPVGPGWWLEPMVGVRWEGYELIRTSLGATARQLARDWAARAVRDGRADEVVHVFRSVVDVYPYEPELWSTFLDAAIAVGDSSVERMVRRAGASALGEALHEAIATVEPPAGRSDVDSMDPTAYRHLGRCERLWADGDVERAEAVLRDIASELTPDVVRRLGRCIRDLRPTDGFARSVWPDIIASAVQSPKNAERAFVAFDAYALEQRADARSIADREISTATGTEELVRALRVRFLVGLSYPTDRTQIDVVRRLASIDDPDAEVEACRFEAVLALKGGRVSDALELLERYSSVLEARWPSRTDDFHHLAIEVLALSPQLEIEIDGVPDRLMPFLANELAVDAAMFWNRLERPDEVHSAVDLVRLRHLTATFPDECAAGFVLFHRLRTEGPEELGEAAHQLLVAMEQRPYQRLGHAAIVALGRWAVAAGDAGVGDRVVELVLPWKDEFLGLWPCDTVIGPASDFIEELRAISPNA